MRVASTRRSRARQSSAAVVITALLVTGAWRHPTAQAHGTAGPGNSAPIGVPTAGDGIVYPNDLRTPAGTLEHGALTVALETRTGAWRPDGDGGFAIDSVLSLAEAGKPAVTPAPLLRVPRGTRVEGTLHNTLAQPLTVYGLGATRAPSDTLMVAPGASRTFAFVASTAGTYPYWVQTGEVLPGFRFAREMPATGVLVVDAPGMAADRVFALTAYATFDTISASGLGRATMAINGLAWPHTEHLDYTVGDSVRWRVINLTELDHPMHLHGFYFRVDGVTEGGTDSSYTRSQQRMAVTEPLASRKAMRIAFAAARPGNWIFHCHYASHLSPRLSAISTDHDVMHPESDAQHASDMPHHMAGLVMGMTVRPRGPVAAAPPPARHFRLEQRERTADGSPSGSLAYAVSEGGVPLTTQPMPVPGPALLLARGQRVEVTVVNSSQQHASVHWHGIELESASDGVPGVSGAPGQVMPMIHPGDSLAVRWTPPRAGSFMYHTHANEAVQMGAGLYGPIIVLEPGARFEGEHDRLWFFGSDGEMHNVIFGSPRPVLLNGAATPPAMQFRVNQRYRLRLFNLVDDFPTSVTLERDGTPVNWRALAKDGYPLQRSQAVSKPAALVFRPGEIYDFEFAPTAVGTYTLRFGLPPGIPGLPPSPPQTRVVVNVR